MMSFYQYYGWYVLFALFNLITNITKLFDKATNFLQYDLFGSPVFLVRVESIIFTMMPKRLGIYLGLQISVVG